MSEMVERVARAMRAALELQGDHVADGHLTSGTAGVIIDGCYDLDAVARAAIAAMREPTEAMYDAAREYSKQNTVENYSGDYWAVFIDAALKD